ncbi:hypothetical protein QVD99_002209 [Batrachochytrium dendrobatidis]|nr:hypothetical protein O5D80_005732 [Batrachochytrium dendrobatidis]KAK5671503.1 hypothetical protein QVD99_002209 [Batrachochytrium dendrobatidis]
MHQVPNPNCHQAIDVSNTMSDTAFTCTEDDLESDTHNSNDFSDDADYSGDEPDGPYVAISTASLATLCPPCRPPISPQLSSIHSTSTLLYKNNQTVNDSSSSAFSRIQDDCPFPRATCESIHHHKLPAVKKQLRQSSPALSLASSGSMSNSLFSGKSYSAMAYGMQPISAMSLTALPPSAESMGATFDPVFKSLSRSQTGRSGSGTTTPLAGYTSYSVKYVHERVSSVVSGTDSLSRPAERISNGLPVQSASIQDHSKWLDELLIQDEISARVPTRPGSSASQTSLSSEVSDESTDAFFRNISTDRVQALHDQDSYHATSSLRQSSQQKNRSALYTSNSSSSINSTIPCHKSNAELSLSRVCFAKPSQSLYTIVFATLIWVCMYTIPIISYIPMISARYMGIYITMLAVAIVSLMAGTAMSCHCSTLYTLYTTLKTNRIFCNTEHIGLVLIGAGVVSHLLPPCFAWLHTIHKQVMIAGPATVFVCMFAWVMAVGGMTLWMLMRVSWRVTGGLHQTLCWLVGVESEEKSKKQRQLRYAQSDSMLAARNHSYRQLDRDLDRRGWTRHDPTAVSVPRGTLKRQASMPRLSKCQPAVRDSADIPYISDTTSLPTRPI